MFKDFFTFLKNKNIEGLIVGSILSSRIDTISEDLLNYIILPILSIDRDNDGKADITVLEKMNINIYGITFEIGKFLISLIKFIIILLLLFISFKLFNL